MSVQQSGFTINRKYKPVAGDETKLQFGDIIRFYHKEMEAYLVAEGLFDDETCEDGKGFIIKTSWLKKYSNRVEIDDFCKKTNPGVSTFISNAI